MSAADRDANQALPSPSCRRRRLPPPLLPQSNEQRYRLLEGKHTTLLADKEKLFQENETLRQVRLHSAAASRACRFNASLPAAFAGLGNATTHQPLPPWLCRSSRRRAWSTARRRRR